MIDIRYTELRKRLAWSRKISGEHRQVYRVFDGRVEIVQARNHYDA